jgi:hypothetical protein
MPQVRKRRQARVYKRIKREVAAEAIRQVGRIERAITDAALRLSPGAEGVAGMLPSVIWRWNTGAAEIERHFGARVFPVRLRHASAISLHFADVDGNPINPLPIYGKLSNRLTYMAAISGDPDTYKWMNDFLFMSLIVPEAAIIHEARSRAGWWRTKGRKQKLGMDFTRQKALQDQLADQMQGLK